MAGRGRHSAERIVRKLRRADEARVVIGDVKQEHDHRHRHLVLGYRMPADYAARSRHTHCPVACEIN